jgi:hypothetical protein
VSPLAARLLCSSMTYPFAQRANKAEFDKLVLRAKGKPGQESPSLNDRVASSDPNSKVLVEASGNETDMILITSDIEG